MNPSNCCILDTCKMQWFLYFLYYVQAAQPFPSTKTQASSMAANTILVTYPLTGGLYTGHETCHLECDTTITIDVVIVPLMGIENVMCGLLLWRPQQSVGLLWHLLYWCRQYLLLYMMTCEPMILFCINWYYLLYSLEQVILNLTVKKGHMEFWGNLRCCTAL